MDDYTVCLCYSPDIEHGAWFIAGDIIKTLFTGSDVTGPRLR